MLNLFFNVLTSKVVCVGMKTNHWAVTGIWNRQNVARFNFTWALPGGAWLETRKMFISDKGEKISDREWFSASVINEIMGEGEFMRLVKKQGFFTGCWIDV